MRRGGEGEDEEKGWEEGVKEEGQGGREGGKPQSGSAGGAEAQEPLSKETFQTDGGGGA